MEEYAKGIGARTREFDSHADKSVVTNLDFKFNNKFAAASFITWILHFKNINVNIKSH